MELDEKTYGDSQAAINLVNMLNELNDEKVSHVWGTIYHRFTKTIRQLYQLKEGRMLFAKMLVDHTVGYVAINPTLSKHPLVQSHATTTIKTHYKRFLRDSVGTFSKRK